MSSPSTSTATLAFARWLRIARPRMSTASVGPRPEGTRECGGGGGVHGQWPGKIQLPRGIASRLGGGEIAGIAGRRGGPEKEGDPLRLLRLRGGDGAKLAPRHLARHRSGIERQRHARSLRTFAEREGIRAGVVVKPRLRRRAGEDRRGQQRFGASG